MFRSILLLSTALLVCSCAGSNAPNNTTGNIVFGCYCNQNGQNSEADFQAFQTAMAPTPVGVDNNYSPFAETSMVKARWDIANGITPMLSVSCRISNTQVALYADQIAGDYDPQIVAKALAIKSVPGKVMLRLFFEPTNAGDEKLCNPMHNGTLFQQVWSHWRTIFDQQGVTNVTWVFNCGEKCWASGAWEAFYPQSQADIVSEDVYNDGLKPENFPGEICKAAAALGKPIMISETGAQGAMLQEQWFGSVKNACPNLSYIVPFDSAPGGANYVISDPAAFAALKSS